MGVFYYADIAPIDLIAGVEYAVLRLCDRFNNQSWADVGPTTCVDAEYVCGCFTTGQEGAIGYYINNPGMQYCGMDIEYVPTVAATRGVADLKVRLMQGTTQIAEWSHADIADTFAVTEQTLTAPQFAAIGDFAVLEVEFDDNKGNVYRTALSNPHAGMAQPVKVRYRYRKLVA